MGKKFKSLGQINPFEKPIEFEYKPLGLELFAEPLAAMQANYDATELNLENASYKIDNISSDDERSKYLVQELEADRDAILKELQRTGNARAAAKDLNRLNKFYNEDPEVLGIRTQLANYSTDYSENKKRAEEGKINKEDLDRESLKVLLGYDIAKGHGSREDVLAGDGRNIARFNIHEDLEEELFKDLTTLAKSTPKQYEKVFDATLQKLIKDYDLEGLPFKDIEYRDRAQVARELYNYVILSDRYQNFLNNKAERDSYLYSTPGTNNVPNKYYDKDFVGNTINERYNKLVDLKNQFDNVVNNSNYSKDQRESAKVQSENIQKAIDEFRNNHNKSVEGGYEKEFAQNIYKTNYANDFLEQLSDASSDLYDFNKQDFELTLPKGEGKKNIQDEKGAKVFGITTQNIETENLTPVVPGTASSVTPVQKEMVGKQIELAEFMNLSTSEMSNMYDGLSESIENAATELREIVLRSSVASTLTKNEEHLSFNDLSTESMTEEERKLVNSEMLFPHTYENLFGGEDNLKKIRQLEAKLDKHLNNWAKLKGWEGSFTDKLNQLNLEIIDLENNLNTGDVYTNNRNLSKLKEKNNERLNLLTEQQITAGSLRYDIEEAINELSDDLIIGDETDFAKLYGTGNLKTALKQAFTQGIELIPEEDALIANQSKEGEIQAVGNVLNDWINSRMYKTGIYGEDTPLHKGMNVFNKVEGARDRVLAYKSYQNLVRGVFPLIEEDFNSISNLLTTPQKWKETQLTKAIPASREVLFDKDLETQTNGVSTLFKSEILNAKAMTAGAPRRGTFNPSTGKFTENTTTQEYNIDNYDINTIRLQGTAQGEGGEDHTVISIDRNNLTLDNLLKEYTFIDNDQKKRIKNVLLLGSESEQVAAISELEENDQSLVGDILLDLKLNVPKTLTLALSAYSKELTTPLKENVSEYIKVGMQQNDAKVVSESLNNFASVGVLLDSELLVDMNQLSVRLQNLVATNNYTDYAGVENTPWEYLAFDESTNQYTGYSIAYSNDEEDGPIASVFKNIFDEFGKPINVSPIPVDKIMIQDFNVPSVLYNINLLYGVGQAKNLLIDQKGRYFIPMEEADETSKRTLKQRDYTKGFQIK